MKVEMKDPTFFEDKENLFTYASSTEPQHCVDSDNRAEIYTRYDQ